MPSHHETYHPSDYHPPDGSWASSDPIRRTMLHNRARDTKPELAIRREVHRRGMRYRVAMRPLKAIRRSADLVFTRAKVAVFVDGCFWHQCPEHFRMPSTNTDYWAAKIAGNQSRDHETDQLLRDAGWEVARVWEHETTADAASLVEGLVTARRTPPRAAVGRK